MVDPSHHYGFMWSVLHTTVDTFSVPQKVLVGYGIFSVSNRIHWSHFTFSEIDRDFSSVMLDNSVIRNTPLLSMV